MKIPTTLWMMITLTHSNIRVSVSSSPGSQWPGSSPSQVITTMAIMGLMVLTMITKKVIMVIVVTTITMDLIMTMVLDDHSDHGVHDYDDLGDHNGYRDDLKIVQFRKEIYLKFEINQ